MISDFEHMLISAVRYALGRRTYIVEVTCNYVACQIPSLSDNCKKIMIYDIEHPFAGYDDECDKEDWMELLKKLKAGDYIIRGVNGEIYPCKPDIFMQTYERVEE